MAILTTPEASEDGRGTQPCGGGGPCLPPWGKKIRLDQKRLHGGSIKKHLKTPRTSRLYDTERFNPFMPTVAFNICCPRDCVSRHNGGTSRR